MSSQDELRDRIEAAALKASDDGVDPAQAIIDDLGLHVVSYETVGLGLPDGPECGIVGKWEKR